ncbi:MAG: D-2-hydroxyacid dehydrogenase [Lacipirellulaceae bacterium]
MRVVLCYPVDEQHRARIQRVLDASGERHELIDAGQARIATELNTADIYCGHAKVSVPWDEVMRRSRLRWIQSSAAGMDHCLVPSVVQSDIPVTSASGVLANQVCDHGLALLLGCLRSLPVFDNAKRQREFIRRPTRDLHGARVGIVGLGGNGRRLAEVLAAFRVQVHATDYFPIDKPPHVASLLPPEGLDGLLPTLDALVLAAPLNDQTRGMIDARRLALLPRGGVVVNMARGPLVVEKDLVAALASGHLGGAGLDVTEVEPLSDDSPLWDAPNLILTPHVGGQAKTRIDDMTEFFCENLSRFLRGEPLLNLVDKSLGFPRPENAAWRRR